MKFFLGTHKPEWLSREEFSGIPLFLSVRRLRDRKTWKHSITEWAIDSGGFTELTMFGSWQTSAVDYASDVRRAMEGPGVQWATVQDWMCEPFILNKTGKKIIEHQMRTIDSYHELKRLAPEVNWVPVLQGWNFDDYLRHASEYASSGVNLASMDLVGLGSVCRRQDTGMVESIIRELHGRGIKLHGFGFKSKGLTRVNRWLESSDSLAWSLQARLSEPLPECTHGRCANCQRYALLWREKLIDMIGKAKQCRPVLFN